MEVSEVVWDALIKPIEIFVKDPAVTFTNIYVSDDDTSLTHTRKADRFHRRHSLMAFTTPSLRFFLWFIRPFTIST